MKTAFFAAVRTGIAGLALPAMFAIQGVFDRTTGVPTTNQMLMNAASTHNSSEVRNALAEGAAIDATDEIGCTALLYAAASGNEDIVRMLLDQGAEVDARGEFGMTPLMFAACFDRAEIVRILLERGANPGLRTSSHSLCALDFAITNDSFAAAELLERREFLQK